MYANKMVQRDLTGLTCSCFGVIISALERLVSASGRG